jgi:hypothetical protein
MLYIPDLKVWAAVRKHIKLIITILALNPAIAPYEMLNL